jgi:hypothetical protein
MPSFYEAYLPLCMYPYKFLSEAENFPFILNGHSKLVVQAGGFHTVVAVISVGH